MTRGLAFTTMKICIALTTLSGRSPDRFGDFYKVALPGVEGRSPFLFRCKPEAEGDDRYFYLPGDEAAFNKDMNRLMKDSRFNSWGMCVFAIPSDDTAPATGSEPGEDGYTPPTKEEWEAFRAEFDKVVEDLAKVSEMNTAFQKAEEERLSIPAVVAEAPTTTDAPAPADADTNEANKPDAPETPDGSGDPDPTVKDSLQVGDRAEEQSPPEEFTSGVLSEEDAPTETPPPPPAPAKKQATKQATKQAKKQAKKQAAEAPADSAEA